MLIPKSYKVRHNILKFLADKRREQDPKNINVDTFAFTVTEIANQLRVKRHLVDEQLDLLYKSKEVSPKYSETEENKFFINDQGLSTIASRTILNDGQLINSQLLNNYASALFQFIVCVVAIWTVYQNVTTIDSLTQENKRVQTQLDLLLKYQLESKGHESIQNYSVDTTANHQTNFQK
jgi:hypothetical protein